MGKIILLIGTMFISLTALALEPGETEGNAIEHNTDSLAAGLASATVALPAGSVGDSVYFGTYADLPDVSGDPVPIIIFQHGSSGINPKLGYDKWQTFIAEQGAASIIFDSKQLADRIKYKSPVSSEVYEKVHALRASEIDFMLEQMLALPWVDKNNVFLSGTSEGAITVARNNNEAFAGRIIYSWSCEDNYFVNTHNTAVNPGQPTLNLISQTDKYFSTKNDFIGNTEATGNCTATLAENETAEVLTIPGAPHTLINLPAAKSAVAGWLNKVIK